MIGTGYYRTDQGPDGSSYNAWVKAEAQTHRKRVQRIKVLQREIMVAKRKLREYDRFLDELGKIRQEEADYFKRLCAPPSRR